MTDMPMARYCGELEAEIRRLRDALNAVGTPIFRSDIIEECAQVADKFGYDVTAVKIADAIRRLKDKP